MLSKLAIVRYEPLLVLQHVHDYLQCQNRYNMFVLPRMKLENKIDDMPCLPTIWICAQLTWAKVGLQSTTFDPGCSYTEP